MEPKELHELSSKATTPQAPRNYASVPEQRTRRQAPAVESKPKDHWVLSYRVPATAGTEKGFLGFSLVVVGADVAE